MNHDMEEARRSTLDKATEIIIEKKSQADMNTKQKDIIVLIAKDNKELKEAGEDDLSFETMRDQVITFLGVGNDTTTGVAWTLHLLSKYPDIQTKLRTEIKEFMPFLFDEKTRYSAEELAKVDVDRLPYLYNVCRESLRYIPPVPLIVRQSIAPDMLGPHDGPAGILIFVLANAVNRLPMYWGPTADEFNPDRWEKLSETCTTNAFMTFLQGPRFASKVEPLPTDPGSLLHLWDPNLWNPSGSLSVSTLDIFRSPSHQE